MNNSYRSGQNVAALAPLAATICFVLLVTGCATGSSSASKHPMPTYNGENGVLSYGLASEWTKNTSLRDWTVKPDFVIAGHVTGQTLYNPPPPASQDSNDPVNTWNSIRHVTVDRVLWQRPDGIEAPARVSFLDAGWVTDDDGKAYPRVPDEGVRLDVGDHFVAAIVNLHNVYPAEAQQTADYKTMPSHWSVLGPGAALIVEDGKIVTGRRTPPYEQDFGGSSVDQFAAKVRAAAKS